MAPPRFGADNVLELEVLELEEAWGGEVWLGEESRLTVGVDPEVAVMVEAPGVQVGFELPPIVILPLQASWPAASETYNKTSVPGFKLVLYW